MMSGIVKSVALSDGKPYLLVDGRKVNPADLLIVTDKSVSKSK